MSRQTTSLEANLSQFGVPAHELKCDVGPFQEVWEGRKNHEIRSCADRKFERGDVVILREWMAGPELYTGRAIILRISYVSIPSSYGLSETLCVFSFWEMFKLGGHDGTPVPRR